MVPGVADVERGVRVEEPGEQLARARLAVLGDHHGCAEGRREAAQHDLQRAQPAPRGPDDDEGDGHELRLRAHAALVGSGAGAAGAVGAGHRASHLRMRATSRSTSTGLVT